MEQQKAESLLEAKNLLISARNATLSVIDPETGGPFGTLVNVAVDAEATPVLLVSKLSRHVQALLKDPRASVMVAGPPPLDRDPLTELRLTVTGHFKICKKPESRQVYLARHPYASLYADFGDFNFWRMRPDRIFVVGGFGRIYASDFKDILDI